MHRFLGTYIHHDRTVSATVVLSTATSYAAHTVQAKDLASRLAMMTVAGGLRAGDIRALLALDGGTLGDEVGRVAKILGEPIEVLDVHVVSTRDPLPVPVAGGYHGDVSFFAENDYGISAYDLGWLHGGGPPGDVPHGTGKGRSQYRDLADFSARGWGLYQDGELHDGFVSIAELLGAFDDGVYLSMTDFKAGRAVPIEDVIDAARAFVGLPSLADDPDCVGPHEDNDEEDDS